MITESLLRQVAMVLTLVLSEAHGQTSPSVPPGAGEFQWESATPESQGMSSEKLATMRDDLAARKTTGLLVIRNDKIVCEWYAPGQSAKSKHGTASMAKAVVGGVSLAVAMSDGRITLDDPAAKFVPQWRNDPQKSRITIRQLGSHTSGIEDAEADNLPHDKLTGWKGDFWKRLPPPRDPFTIARDEAPVLFEPGTKMAYSNPGIAMLTYTVTASLRDAPHKDIRTLLRERVMRPIGVPDEEWSVGYGQTPVVDGLPLVGSWGGGSYTARAAASVGRLMLREGDWDGRRLFSPDAVRQVTRDVGTPGNCGIGWWSNNDGSYPELPKDAFCGTGAGHQIMLVVPSLNLIAVRNGDTIEATGGEPNAYHVPLRQYLFEPLVKAIVRSVPVRASKERVEGIPPSNRGQDARDTTPGSHPELIQLNNMFAPGAVDGEMRVWDADTGPVALPQTNNKGGNYPKGIDYPLTVEVPLRGGHALRFHSLQMPESLAQARFYWNEYPRQIENKRGFAFKAWEGWPGNRNVRFPNDQPISCRYEVVIVPQKKAP